MLGITEQLHRAPGFGWTGNLTPPRLPEGEQAELDGRLEAVCAEITARFGVRGAFGVDAIWDGRHAWMLEVNPRPPAGLELFGPGSFEAHVRAARGLGLPVAGSPPATRCAKVKLVLFAPRDLRAPDPGWWPAGLVRDIPHAGETIRRGEPVCTLISAIRRGPGARRVWRESAVCDSRSGACRWLSSDRSPARGVRCCATTCSSKRSGDDLHLLPRCDLGAEWFAERVAAAQDAPAATIRRRAGRCRDRSEPRRRVAARGPPSAAARLRRGHSGRRQGGRGARRSARGAGRDRRADRGLAGRRRRCRYAAARPPRSARSVIGRGWS